MLCLIFLLFAYKYGKALLNKIFVADLLSSEEAYSGLFKMVRWRSGVYCPRYGCRSLYLVAFKAVEIERHKTMEAIKEILRPFFIFMALQAILRNPVLKQLSKGDVAT